jgi:D-sedoheptulose 7-phosphate isomerase
MFVEEGDILFAISSSGNSANIINAVERAKTKGIYVVGLSGFDENNKLKTCADFNIYVPRNHYGYVELAHQIILHMLTDTLGGVVE